MPQYVVKYKGKIKLAGNFPNATTAKKEYKSHFMPWVSLSELSATKVPKGLNVITRDRTKTFQLSRKKF